MGGSLRFLDFADPGRFDVLVNGPGELQARTVEGRPLWSVREEVRQLEASTDFDPAHGRLLYCLVGNLHHERQVNVVGGPIEYYVADEMVVLAGRTGKVLARRKVDFPVEVDMLRHLDWSDGTGNLTGGGRFDIVLREWRKDKGGGVNLWAFDRRLNLLWRDTIETAWYGHHWAVQFFDADADGRDELLAGGILYDASGRRLWVHDRAEEMLAIHSAQHYDAVAIGHFAGDAQADPVAFLLGGSAGLYVADGLTGRTRAVHRIGHAQGRAFGKARADLPGTQVLAMTRWGNMGILTLFSGRGERLWTRQSDYRGQGAEFVTWPGGGPQLIWSCTSGPNQALYDGFGRRVRELRALPTLCGDRMRKDLGPRILRMGDDGQDYLGMHVDGLLHVFGPRQ